MIQSMILIINQVKILISKYNFHGFDLFFNSTNSTPDMNASTNTSRINNHGM